jgi:hypothetical protein
MWNIYTCSAPNNMISLFKTVLSNENDPTWDRTYIVIAENGMLHRAQW